MVSIIVETWPFEAADALTNPQRLQLWAPNHHNIVSEEIVPSRSVVWQLRGGGQESSVIWTISAPQDDHTIITIDYDSSPAGLAKWDIQSVEEVVERLQHHLKSTRHCV